MQEKEIWKLLEEYLQTKNKDIQDFMSITALMAQSDNKLYQTYIISKDFWFVKRLVEQDKIDLVKFSDKLSSPSWTMEDRYKYLNSDFWLYNSLLMLLSISEQPIEDLISYLK